MRFILRWLVNAGVLLVAAGQINTPLVNGRDPFTVDGFGAACGAVVLITLANFLLQPLSLIGGRLGCLINVVTLGLWGLVVSFGFYVVAFWLVGTFELIDGFFVAGFREAALGALALAVVNAFLSPLLEPPPADKRSERREK